MKSSFQGDTVDLTLLDEVLADYRGQPGALIAVLQKAQDIYGYLPFPVLQHISAELRLKPAKVFGVATFYTQFRLAPVGKHVILLCQGTACHVNGSELIAASLCEELRLKQGETTPDGLFTLQKVACLGCCSLAPAMMINGRAFGQLTPEKASRIIREIAEQEKQGAAEEEKR